MLTVTVLVSFLKPPPPPGGWGSHGFSYSSTRGTLANRFILNPISYVRTELGTEVGGMEGILPDDGRLFSARSSLLPTVPSKSVDTFRGPCSLDDNASGIRKPHRIMGRVRGKQENFSLPNGNVKEGVIDNDSQQHAAFILIEPFLGLVDMIIRSFVWPSYSHHDEIIPGVKTKGINWRLEEFGILSDPFMQVKRGGN